MRRDPAPPAATIQPVPHRIAPRRAGSLAALCCSVLALAGCGSSSAPGPGPDPAGVVPAGAPLFLGATVRPPDPQKTAALAAGRALTHQADPYLRLVAVLQTPGSPALDFSRDLAPWLGRRAGLFFTSAAGTGSLLPLIEQGVLGTSTGASSFPFTGAGASGAIVLDTTDEAKARSFLSTQAARAGARAASLDGVSYESVPSGPAFALVDRFAVIGSEAGVRAVIETAHTGASLSRAPGYAKLLAQAPAEALAHVYVDPGTSSPAHGSGSALALLAGSRQSNISLVAGPTSLTVYADSAASAATGTPGGLLTSVAEGGRSFATLPGDSWLAVGLGNLGQTLGANVNALREIAQLGTGLAGAGASTGTLSIGSLLEGLLTPLSALAANTAQARADFTSWMGSGALFAAGSGLLELKAAVVIESHNPARSRAAVAKLAALITKGGGATQPVSIPGTDAAVAARLRGLPLALDIADGANAAGGSSFVLGLGEGSVSAALNPSSTLGASASSTAAAGAIGEGLKPSLLFEPQTLLGLLEGIGLNEDPSVSKLIPYLRAVTTVYGAGHALAGEVERFKLLVGLRPAGG